MILADTSIWVDHFRGADDALSARLREGAVLMHPFVIGELSLGGIREGGRGNFDLRRLAYTLIARHGEVMAMIAQHDLTGSGIGWVDAHLLCAARLTADCRLWSRDRKLRAAAGRLMIAYDGG